MITMRCLLCAVAALLVLTGSSVTAQQSVWPPVLLDTPSDASAPSAVASVISGRGRLLVNAVVVDPQDNIFIAGTGNALDIPGLNRGFKAAPDG